ncbi:MAG: hypothetical protein JNL08_05745 [Planctomycetes bacterium]|nr:hypothetical protein [Planctomycetota bacterium]
MPKLALVASLLTLTGAAIAAPQKHPHFDDRGTLAWHTTLAAAKAAARAEDKLILVEYGREA